MYSVVTKLLVRMAGIWSVGVIAFAAEKGNVMYGIDMYSVGGILLWLSSEFAWKRRPD